jgi:plasmid stabilization system protein ParE
LAAATKVSFHPGAEGDYVEAFAWYFGHNSSIAYDFEHEVERGLRLISESPLRWPKFDTERRQIILRKFPYSLIYEIVDGEAVILAVAHGRRRPYYWRDRSARS